MDLVFIFKPKKWAIFLYYIVGTKIGDKGRRVFGSENIQRNRGIDQKV